MESSRAGGRLASGPFGAISSGDQIIEAVQMRKLE